MELSRPDHSSTAGKVISPFADSEVIISRAKGSSMKLVVVIGACLLLIVVGAVGGMLVIRYIDNPFRILEPFPVSKYLDDYQALAGSKYKADLRVEADLGWKDGAGRLMLFSTSDDSRPVAVFVPTVVANGIYFTKGQTYTAEIEVKEGGLIYADSFQKN